MKKDDPHPIFQYTSDDFVLNKPGLSSIQSESFLSWLKDFPTLPSRISPEALLALGMYFKSKGTFVQQNFWVYMMMECDTDTYNSFVSYHAQDIQDKVSPIC